MGPIVLMASNPIANQSTSRAPSLAKRNQCFILLCMFFIFIYTRLALFSLQRKEMVDMDSEIGRFFKILMPNFSTKLFFPPRVAEQIRKSKSSDKITLVSPNCKMWHVNLHIENNGVFMGGENWQYFIQDNELEAGYILHFKYKGNMVFTFRIYDKTSCERVSEKKKIIKNYIDLESDSYSTPMQAVRSSQRRRGREENTLNAKASKSATASNKRSTKGEEHRNTSKIISYFETTITANSLTQRYLYIPKASRETIGLSSEHIGCLITVPSGQSWLVGFSNGGRSSTRMSKGWAEFILKTQLKAGDRVRFEVVSAKREDNVMHLKMIKL